MNINKQILTIVLMLSCSILHAQIKMHSNGRITFQTIDNTTNQGISFEPGPNCQANFNGKSYFKECVFFTRNVSPYQFVNNVKANGNYAVAWVVTLNDFTTTRFFVHGKGDVYGTHYYTINNVSNSKGMNTKAPINGKDALRIITGLHGGYFQPEEEEIPILEDNENVVPEAIEAMYADFAKAMVELDTDRLEEVFPEAVRTDPQNRLCIDYQAVVTMLVEAVKEQQAEIQQLQHLLRENGLSIPKK